MVNIYSFAKKQHYAKNKAQYYLSFSAETIILTPEFKRLGKSPNFLNISMRTLYKTKFVVLFLILRNDRNEKNSDCFDFGDFACCSFC